MAAAAAGVRQRAWPASSFSVLALGAGHLGLHSQLESGGRNGGVRRRRRHRTAFPNRTYVLHSPNAQPPPRTAVIAHTSLGWAGVALSEIGIRRASLFRPNREAVATELAACGAAARDHPRAADITEAFAAYDSGQPDALDHYPIDLEESITPLPRAVWLALRDIPAGEMRSYGWLARHVGEPTSASRAIGALVGSNPIPLWLPCHRVIASDGTLHGFGGGLAMKQAILELEGALPRRLL